MSDPRQDAPTPSAPTEAQETSSPLAPDLEAALREAEAHAEGLKEKKTEEAEASRQGERDAVESKSDPNGANETADQSASEVIALQTQLATAQKQTAEMKEGMLRARADLENARRRFEREKKEDQLYAGERVLKALIPVVDDLDRALENIPADGENDQTLVEGVQMVHRKFLQALESQGAKSFYPLGEQFDPTNHEALMEMPTTEVDPGHIAQVFQRGWLLNERLLRPAKVIIAKAP